MVISIANEKGGCGKTTISINTAVKLGLLGEDTLLIDADPQRSIEVFTNIRDRQNIDLTFNTVAKFGSSLAKEVLSLKAKYDAIIIDTGGRDSEEMRQALAVSDLVIIPTVPSDLDIAVLNKMINIFNQSKAFNPTSKALITISRASPNPFLSKKIEDLKAYIQDKKLEDIKLCDTIIYELEGYKNAFSNGQGVLEFYKEGKNAYRDFDNFFNELVAYANN
jgi:chromosome partitioning protein